MLNTEFESCLAGLKNYYWNFFKLDWSQDPSKRAILTGLFAQTFGEDIFPEAWLLANVVTHKDYQRRGIGARLVRWGLDQCEAERVPCGVESSFAAPRLGGHSLYDQATIWMKVVAWKKSWADF